jgi:hypothetical protein
MGKANTSGGVIPWIKLLNDTAIAVNQGGRRAGAITVSLDVLAFRCTGISGNADGKRGSASKSL